MITVHNEGEPIPPETIGTLFNALTRAEARADDSSGHGPLSVNLGLGLYIVQEIVIAHGGQIEVVSTERDGTTFTIHLMR